MQRIFETQLLVSNSIGMKNLIVSHDANFIRSQASRSRMREHGQREINLESTRPVIDAAHSCCVEMNHYLA
jgi:hypothetical protein